MENVQQPRIQSNKIQSNFNNSERKRMSLKLVTKFVT